MLFYQLRLALLSFKRNPGLTAVMIGAIGVGIGAAMVIVSTYYAFSANPIWWKNDQLYAIALDNKSPDPKENYNDPHPDYPSTRLTHRDAHALLASDIPTRAAVMYQSSRILEPQERGAKASRVSVRLTTADFFPMFDVPFRFGSGWTRAADDGPEPVVVISKALNDSTFNGANSVGRTLRLNGRDYRVVGVLGLWQPFPKFYDLGAGGSLNSPEDLFLPLRWGDVLELFSTAGTACQRGVVTSFKGIMDGECMYLQFWAELPSAEQYSRYRQFIDAYVTDQKKQGRFPRPLNNWVANVSTWLDMNDVVTPEHRMFLAMSMMFLVVCVLNTLGMILAKSLRAANLSSLRRALGASRGHIFSQHLTESMLVGVLGGLLGLLLTLLGLAGLRAIYAPLEGRPGTVSIKAFTQLEFNMVLFALGLALLVGLLGGLYPAWRACRVSPSVGLKSM